MKALSEDVLRFYMGIKMQWKWCDDDEIRYCKLCSLFSDSFMLFPEPIDGKGDIEINDYKKDGELKLILRHPCDMTPGELKCYYNLCQPRYGNSVRWIADTPESILYLAKNHIDAFNLIDRGLAINASWYSEPDKIIPRNIIDIEPTPGNDYTETEMLTIVKDDKPYEFYVHPKEITLKQ